MSIIGFPLAGQPRLAASAGDAPALVGTRGVIVVGFVAGILATTIGVIVGVTAGYVGGLGDESLSVLVIDNDVLVGIVTQGDERVAAFSGTIRKPSRK